MPKLTAAEIAAMRAEVLDTQLDHTCTVQRRSNGAVDADNVPTTVWGAHLTAVPCHYWRDEGVELVGGQNVDIVRERIVFQANTDIRTSDRVTSVLDNDGDQLVTVALDIEDVRQDLNQVVITAKVAQ